MKFPFSLFTVHGNSMEPILKPGQKLMSFNWWINPKKGDLVAVQQNGRLMVKRVEQMKGEELFVVGDNPEKSTDSRKFGWIKRDQIIGKIIYRAPSGP